MQKSKFQMIIIVVFIFAAVVALILFSKKKSGGTADVGGTVVVWGTFPQDALDTMINTFNNTSKTFRIQYIQRPKETFETDLAEGIASGVGPDLVFITQDQVIRLDNKLYHIPYESLSERSFRDAYIEQGQLMLAADGIIALPLTVDPMVLFYNQDLLQDAGITKAPATWGDLKTMAPLFTKKDGTTIVQSAVALGAYKNVSHAKDIFAMMLLQLGNPIIGKNAMGGYASSFATVGANKINGAIESLRFQTQFTDPLSPLYTWNRAKDNSQDAFVNGELAFYLGYASEIPTIAARNPNLNFDIARAPQINTTNEQTTIGNMTSVGIIKTSKNFTAAYTAATTVISLDPFVNQLVSNLMIKTPVAPARLALLGRANYPKNLYGQLLYNSALISKGWLDPHSASTNPIFSTLFDSVVSGAKTPDQAVFDAQSAITRVLGN
jgi:ABC-type glycerol-3-phosphate transport system substrate-binding protein